MLTEDEILGIIRAEKRRPFGSIELNFSITKETAPLDTDWGKIRTGNLIATNLRFHLDRESVLVQARTIVQLQKFADETIRAVAWMKERMGELYGSGMETLVNRLSKAARQGNLLAIADIEQSIAEIAEESRLREEDEEAIFDGIYLLPSTM